MAKKRTTGGKASGPQLSNGTEDVSFDYRHHHAQRLNNPTGGNATQGKVGASERNSYAYDPHRPPTLRYDATGRSDGITERMAWLLAKAQAKPSGDDLGSLTVDEATELAEALRQGQPWLEWAGKREQPAFVVDAPAIHLHERISTRALLRIASRRDVQRNLFGESELPYPQSVQFYRHSVNWANRLILGDNRAVMASLDQREGLAGKVQMIYIDPPYGIKFASNFQTEIGKRGVKESESDLTREMEVVRAYRDTWTLGIHSYISYMKDCLTAAKELLAEDGSVFVQISDQNLHHVRELLDEVFRPSNFVVQISYRRLGMMVGERIQSSCHYLVWYAKNKEIMKFRKLYEFQHVGVGTGDHYTQLEDATSGERRPLQAAEKLNPNLIPAHMRPYQLVSLATGGYRPNTTIDYAFQGGVYHPGSNKCWRTTREGLDKLALLGRIVKAGNTIRYKQYLGDFPLTETTTHWDDTARDPENYYVVQTPTNIIKKCILMTTDPGDLVLDPTCGSGTTAYVAEQWGRRWITIDTSRVALALARQRLMTAKFDYYRLRDESNGPNGGFYYKSVPYITLKSIAQNASLDPILARHEPILADRLAVLNAALSKVTPAVRAKLESKLAAKRKAKVKDDPISDADERRWNLPEKRWEESQVPFDTDPDWPRPLQEALIGYRKAWRAKMDEANAAIAANAEQKALVDQPEVAKGIVRVSGPFTVEALQPVEESIESQSPIDPIDDTLETFVAGAGGSTTNAEAYLDKMIRLLRVDGVRFPNNVQVAFDNLDSLSGGILNAAGEWRPERDEGKTRSVAVVFGPQYGPITGTQVESALRAAHRARIYDDIVFAGFSFDSGAQAVIQDDPNPRVRCHLAFIRPDVNLTGLLKETPNSQLFTVFGLPRARLESVGGDRYRVLMEGVDVYNPVKNEIVATGADKVAAWFLDSDYDNRTFCICQAFFPNRSAWDKLGKALKGLMDEDVLDSFSGTISQPFHSPKGPEPKVAVKVIDPRGNEVLRVLSVPSGE